jgi:hypothetical protein
MVAIINNLSTNLTLLTDISNLFGYKKEEWDKIFSYPDNVEDS